MKYCAPNINKCIVNLWKLIAYVSATSAKSGTSGTNFAMLISQLENMQML